MSVVWEGAKGRPEREGVAAVVARLGHQASRDLFDASEESVLAAATPPLTALLGPPAARPAWSQVKRWRLAEPEGRLDPNALNPPGTRVVLTGDAFCGPDLAAVYDEGLAAAARVMALSPVGSAR